MNGIDNGSIKNLVCNCFVGWRRNIFCEFVAVLHEGVWLLCDFIRNKWTVKLDCEKKTGL